MAITLTDNAAKRVKDFLANRGKGVGLRLGQHALLDQRVNKIEHRIAQLEQIRLFAGADRRGGGQADEQNGKTS